MTNPQKEIEELAHIFNKYMDINRDCNDGLGLATLAIKSGYRRVKPTVKEEADEYTCAWVWDWPKIPEKFDQGREQSAGAAGQAVKPAPESGRRAIEKINLLLSKMIKNSRLGMTTSEDWIKCELDEVLQLLEHCQSGKEKS